MAPGTRSKAKPAMAGKAATRKATTSRKGQQSQKKSGKAGKRRADSHDENETGKGRKCRATSDDSSSDEDDSDTEEEVPRHKKKPRKSVVVEEVSDDEVPEVIEVVVDERRSAEDDEMGSNENKDDQLEARHIAEIPDELVVKEDSMRDLLTIFSDRVKVHFTPKNGDKPEELTGRWCTICKTSAKFLASHGKRKAFHVGGNSSCRSHIRQHYEEYKARCAAQSIPLHHHAIPRNIWKAMEEREKEQKSKRKQRKLDDVFTKEKGPHEFSREEALQTVTKFITCDDQAISLADKASFRNCLVVMRPKSTTKDLPSAHDVNTHLHNEFVRHLKCVKEAICAAPGKISATSDGWSADTTKESFLGMTIHWIEVDAERSKWTLRSEVLFTVTLDNTSNNTTLCGTIEHVHAVRKLDQWLAELHQLPCLEHVVHLADEAIMSHITKIAVIENSIAIWEYDPSLPGNHVLGGSLDVIAAIRTLVIKIQASGQRIQYFEKLQIECGNPRTRKIPLHSNVRWGTAHDMMDGADNLRSSVNLFISAADELFGPITTIRREGHVVKHIPWAAFKLSETDWDRVRDMKDILLDSKKVLHYFSSDQCPTLWRALPAFEDLQTAWEAKADDPRFPLYHDAIQDGLDKLKKYYSKFDEKPFYILALLLHPYYKLDYIKLAWGGAEEQAAEIAAGNRNAKNWQAEAHRVVEDTVERYWKARPRATSSAPNVPIPPEKLAEMSEYDRLCQSLLDEDDSGWETELRSYLKARHADVTKETDIVAWWAKHCIVYPTLTRIALDVLPSQASSVPCERLFSGSKQTATDRRARLGTERLEELQIMKSAWRGNIVDFAALNSREIEVVELELKEYEDFLIEDEAQAEWEKEMGSVA
ncbi:Zinc finger BED domain-containing protein DAYSLEEPER [Hypsizygus marmoreus]|uniref:Zinc finger BED domain-containing protein DAYSLEEPER n=1 Tax=Hypsizygus marmoreus TaxID=39966 RepID=A0A369JX95_HYPMA|nr:Zinc finger BED domain-containing protein DAYSLEEPER [Hypsizygus marmoreus]